MSSPDRFEMVQGFQDPFSSPRDAGMYASVSSFDAAPLYGSYVGSSNRSGLQVPRTQPLAVSPPRSLIPWQAAGYGSEHEYEYHKSRVNAGMNSHYHGHVDSDGYSQSFPPQSSVSPSYSPRSLPLPATAGRHIQPLEVASTIEYAPTQLSRGLIQDSRGNIYEPDPNYSGHAAPVQHTDHELSPEHRKHRGTLVKAWLITLFLIVSGVALYFGISAFVLGQDKQHKKDLLNAQLSAGA